MIKNKITYLFLLFSLLLCISCARITVTEKPVESRLFNPTNSGDEVIDEFAPHFLVKEAHQDYNLIGRPMVRMNQEGKQEIFVDPDHSSMFFQREDFNTSNARYHNLIYRIHFEQVPFKPGDFHITYGKNVGLLVIITLNEQNVPLLVTTVHTCGCYLAFFPCPAMPPAALPDNWPMDYQTLYGINLPSFLVPDDQQSSSLKYPNIIITLNGGTHRVSNVKLESKSKTIPRYPVREMKLEPMERLSHLKQAKGETSFFEENGPRKGYVKNCTKPLERLLMSWWTMDWNIGVDKAYGDSSETGKVFYTSVKFWRKNDSDMWPFADFLNYWGWKL
ncbi:MAG: hypothetical protein OEM02_00905 [Desulfobulbaceae bacterium]|nr:hypothetical protein [Desulfobulbaceae bacterium]